MKSWGEIYIRFSTMWRKKFSEYKKMSLEPKAQNCRYRNYAHCINPAIKDGKCVFKEPNQIVDKSGIYSCNKFNFFTVGELEQIFKAQVIKGECWELSELWWVLNSSFTGIKGIWNRFISLFIFTE